MISNEKTKQGDVERNSLNALLASEKKNYVASSSSASSASAAIPLTELKASKSLSSYLAKDREEVEIVDTMVNRRGSDNRLAKFVNFMPAISERSLHIAQTYTEEQSANISRVERSWFMISKRLDEVSLKCFLRMFEDHPDLVNIFPFSSDCVYDGNGRLIVDARVRVHIRAHAVAVFRVIGTCVAGLTRFEDLVPKLRHIGATHRGVGVQEMHYAVLYRYIVETIKVEVGSDIWDQETEDAWEQAFTSITDLIKRPSTRLQTEPLEGWGLAIAFASCYFALATPFRLAGFLCRHTWLEILFDLFDFIAASMYAADFLIFVNSNFKVKPLSETAVGRHCSSLQWLQALDELPLLKGKLSYYFEIFDREFFRKRMAVNRHLRKYQMERWIPWPQKDVYVLLTFPLQFMYKFRPRIGLHWTHLLGLFRISSVTRVFHFIQCAENKALFERQLDEEKQVHIRIGKLLVKLFFVIHVAACFWCIVARYELGPDANDPEPSDFFPDIHILFGSETSLLNSYSRAVHWSFVNLAGIGNVQSTPVTTLECIITILTHLVGAIFYAIVTGQVITMIEESASEDGKIGTDIAKLSNLMDSARVSSSSKERIIKGYMLRNVLTRASSSNPFGYTDPDDVLDLNDEVLSTLPKYLQQEIGFFARAEFIRRRDRLFQHCSTGFLVALCSSLTATRTLLAGDYLMKQDEPYDEDGFVLVESGTLQVRQGQMTIKTLEQGSVVGKGWLLLRSQPQSQRLSGSSFHGQGTEESFNEYTEWCNVNRIAGVSIRALSPCVLHTGLTTAAQIRDLEKGYKGDFALLRAEVKSIVKKLDMGAEEGGELKRVSIGIQGAMKATEKFKNMTLRGKFKKKHQSNLHQSSFSEDSSERSCHSFASETVPVANTKGGGEGEQGDLPISQSEKGVENKVAASPSQKGRKDTSSLNGETTDDKLSISIRSDNSVSFSISEPAVREEKNSVSEKSTEGGDGFSISEKSVEDVSVVSEKSAAEDGVSLEKRGDNRSTSEKTAQDKSSSTENRDNDNSITEKVADNKSSVGSTESTVNKNLSYVSEGGKNDSITERAVEDKNRDTKVNHLNSSTGKQGERNFSAEILGALNAAKKLRGVLDQPL